MWLALSELRAYGWLKFVIASYILFIRAAYPGGCVLTCSHDWHCYSPCVELGVSPCELLGFLPSYGYPMCT